VQQAAVGAFSPDFNLEFAISDIDRDFCDAACEAVICWLEVFRKTSSRRLLVRGYLGADNTLETRIRTSAWRNQNPAPYRLATPQCRFL
jgi:hypothetical protein